MGTLPEPDPGRKPEPQPKGDLSGDHLPGGGAGRFFKDAIFGKVAFPSCSRGAVFSVISFSRPHGKLNLLWRCPRSFNRQAEQRNDDSGMAEALARLQQAHGVVALEQHEAAAGGQPLRGFEISVAGEDVFRKVRRALDQGRRLRPGRQPEARIAALARAQHLAAAAQPQILLGDHEAVVDLPQNVEARLRGFRKRGLVEQHAGGLRRAAPHAPAQLVKLGQAEHLGVLDNHHRGVGHVDAHLDDRRRDQDRGFALRERGDGRILLRAWRACRGRAPRARRRLGASRPRAPRRQPFRAWCRSRPPDRPNRPARLP